MQTTLLAKKTKKARYPDDTFAFCAACATEQPIADMEPPRSHRYSKRNRCACAECGSFHTAPKVSEAIWEAARMARRRWEQPFPDAFPSLLDALADEA